MNTAIIYLHHGLLSVRYVALYDRIESSGMYLFRNVNGLLQKISINTFPGKCQDDVQALRFSKTMYHVRLRVGQHSCQNILFRSVDYFDILFRGVNELSILFDVVNELSNIFDAVNEFTTPMSYILLFPVSMS